MKILISVDPEIPVPPIYYGGIERIVDSLINQYTDKGHEVYLIAHRDSNNKKAVKIFPWPRLSSRGTLNIVSNAKALYKAYKTIKPDIIHSFSRLLYLYPLLFLAHKSKLRIVQTYQREINHKSTSLAHFLFGKKLFFTACGHHLIENLPVKKYATGIHNFADTNFYKDDSNIHKKHLMFLGRIQDIKGTKEAVNVALETNNELIIAGNIQPGHDEYFENQIKPYLENPLINYVGPVNDEQKLYYLQCSKAFLFPIKWEEPFGIVMAEAMACGTPVIGFKRGSVPEVVIHNQNGFIVSDVNEMISAVNKIDKIDRLEVRADCEKRFSLEVISKQYISLFSKMTS
ncbi:MAG: glycosyltransferase [Brumimicrobium sp.]|nr:glycosyltransferase [Brumimicrobium sp.]